MRTLSAVARAAVIAVAALLAPAEASRAQSYPSRTITVVVPFPPGGGVDALARIVAEKLSVALKATVVVENRTGGGGTVGTRAVTKAEPDGYTLMLAHTGTISINPSLYANAGYDPRKDFTPIGLIASMPVALVSHPSFPARTVADVIAIARKDPGKLNFGTSAVGTGGYLTAEYFKSVASLDMVIVPYRGTGALMNDLLGGHVPVSFGVLPPAIGNIQAGTLRAIAVLGRTRFSLLPNVPTADESGMPGFEAVLHYGLLAPAGTPKPIVERLNAAVHEVLADAAVRKRLAELGQEIVADAQQTPEALGAHHKAEIEKWWPIIKAAGIKAE